MKRRTFLGAAAATMAAPALVQGQAARTLKFIPHANLTVVDPIWTTAYITRNSGFLIWDTLYGLDESYKPQPQMVEGHTLENDDKLWTFTLREGLKFHDGEPVLARDCVASIARWAKRDAMGMRLAQLTDEMTVVDDRRFRIRLKRPYGLMLDSLAKTPSNALFIMPERVAQTDAFTQIRPEQLVGSGPFTFKHDEYISGSKVVYERFAGYVPRSSGEPSGTAGPKVVHFDRVEWHIIPDFATSGAALQSGEVLAEVREADRMRIEALKRMFMRFGVEEASADVRARTTYLIQIGYITMQSNETLAVRMSRIPEYLAIFTGQMPQQRELDRFFARHGHEPE